MRDQERDDRYAINVAKTEIREGYNTGDPERILARLAVGFTDLSFGFPSFAREEARDVLRVRLNVLFASYEVEFAPISADILPFGQSAVVTGWNSMTLRPKAGGPARHLKTRFLELWQRSDVEWKLRLSLDNVDRAPALAADTIAAVLSGKLDPLTGGLPHP